MRTAKVCIIGDFAVGKTSTVARFVKNEFSEKYLTTVGVKIDTKVVTTAQGPIKLVIWDIAGSDRATDIERVYLRGAAGLVVVADGTRRATLQTGIDLLDDVRRDSGSLPFVALLNKSDLADRWQIDEDALERSAAAGVQWTPCSAKTGDSVATAIDELAARIARNGAVA